MPDGVRTSTVVDEATERSRFDAEPYCTAIFYRVSQLNFTPEVEVFYMVFERSRSIFSRTSLKQHIEYFNFWC